MLYLRHETNWFPPKKAVHIFAIILTCIIVFTVFQDFLQSAYNNYSFYILESLLFKVFWALFLPVYYLQVICCNRIKSLRPSIKATHMILCLTLPAAAIHMLLCAVLIYCISSVCFTHTYAPGDTLGYTLAEDTYILLLFYGVSGFLHFRQQQPLPVPLPDTLPETGHTTTTDRLIIGTGRIKKVILLKDTHLISASGPYVAIHTGNRKHLHTATLKSIMTQLDCNRFVRIHRSTIVNIEKVSSYTSRLNGDYDILLENGEQLRLSRNYAASFKARFTNRTSS